MFGFNVKSLMNASRVDWLATVGGSPRLHKSEENITNIISGRPLELFLIVASGGGGRGLDGRVDCVKRYLQA